MVLFSIHILPCLDVSCEDSLAISAAQREKKLLNGMIQNLLPAVGSSVRSIVLAYSSTVSSKMVWTRNIHDHMPRTSIKQSLEKHWVHMNEGCLRLNRLYMAECRLMICMYMGVCCCRCVRSSVSVLISPTWTSLRLMSQTPPLTGMPSVPHQLC